MPPAAPDPRPRLAAALAAFTTQSLAHAASGLFDALGNWVCHDRSLESQFANQAFRDEEISRCEEKLLVRQVLPIAESNPKFHDRLIALVNQILVAKRADAGADTSALEAEIDRHVYALNGLTPEEIEIVQAPSGSKASVT